MLLDRPSSDGPNLSKSLRRRLLVLVSCARQTPRSPPARSCAPRLELRSRRSYHDRCPRSPSATVPASLYGCRSLYPYRHRVWCRLKEPCRRRSLRRRESLQERLRLHLPLHCVTAVCLVTFNASFPRRCRISWWSQPLQERCGIDSRVVSLSSPLSLGGARVCVCVCVWVRERACMRHQS